ncbi:MAG: YegS/Rv2252/BmrU family lipid kinase [Dorea sp.]|nr:YegS/Rv2252/BmrU family lipid kinase [Dorea sp.]
MKKLLFIYNPRAGQALLKPYISDVVDLFVKAGYEVTIYPTQAYHDAYKKVKSYDASAYDLVVCSGGDGTIDEVVTAMMEREDRNPIGYIPTGTTNDFANSLHIPTDIMKGADNAVNGCKFPCDIGSFNDDYFVYVAAFGIFTNVPYETDQNLKNMLGHFAYLMEGAKQILDIPSYHLKVSWDEGDVEDDFILGMVTNSKSVGGFRKMIGNSVVFDDGLFEVTLIRTPDNIIDVNEIVAALLMNNVNDDHMLQFSTRHIRFEAREEIPWTLDGEFGGRHHKVEVENLPRALEIMVPEKYLHRLTNDENIEIRTMNE